MSDAGARFAELVGGPEADVALDEAALLIAAHAYPDLDVGAQRARLDALAAGCSAPTFDGVRRHLFEELGFAGDAKRYRDPRNSFLNEVLDRRLGIPISLAVLTIEVARRVGVEAEGIGMPGHFLVRSRADPEVLLDPFGGRLLDVAGCRELFRSVHGPAAPFDEALLAPVGPRAILARMLANLRQLYLASGDARSVGWVLRLRVAVPAATPGELADLSGAQAALARFTDAAATLDALAELLPTEAAARAGAEAKALRARLN